MRRARKTLLVGGEKVIVMVMVMAVTVVMGMAMVIQLPMVMAIITRNPRYTFTPVYFV